ncbi:MAG: SRPBCC family protein, partial [Acidobacteriota bacterium]|nr:SRPBCC family protein [Acidobacteriota bacterium]MDQ5873091.1 SRPBCC family protein [Acidobacteriota bacterium]
MKNVGKLQITTPSDREIAMTRAFDAPRKLVYDAWTSPELLKRWLGVRGGWTMAVCEIDLKVGGKYRYVWRGPTGNEMGMGGVYREVVPGERIVATEKFDDAWYEGEAVDTTTFVEEGGKTTVTTTVLYSSNEVRDGVLRSPMEK